MPVQTAARSTRSAAGISLSSPLACAPAKVKLPHYRLTKRLDIVVVIVDGVVVTVYRRSRRLRLHGRNRPRRVARQALVVAGLGRSPRISGDPDERT